MTDTDVDLFGMPVDTNVVNVSSVPQRSPFRYPGGKTWLIPIVRRWLKANKSTAKELIEPFAGGGIVSLTAVAERLVTKATMVELDEDVSAVWETIFGKDGNWLAKELLRFKVTPSSVERVLGKRNRSVRQRAFSTLLKNRVNHGGILAEGAGLLKHGENGKGLLSRWYPETLHRRILNIIMFKSGIDFICGDGMNLMKETADRTDTLYFIDPPYTVAGKRLYQYPNIDHAMLFSLANELKGDFLITYDDALDIRTLASEHGFDLRLIPMMNTHHATKNELLISRNLDWLGL